MDLFMPGKSHFFPPTEHHFYNNNTTCSLILFLVSFASYIVTNRGMHAMFEKYRTAAFGRCPQVFCQGQPVLPVGLSDLPRNYTVNVFCPRCHGLFFPKSTGQANIDGAYFGTTFPHLYLITHPVCMLQVTCPFGTFGYMISFPPSFISFLLLAFFFKH